MVNVLFNFVFRSDAFCPLEAIHLEHRK